MTNVRYFQRCAASALISKHIPSELTVIVVTNSVTSLALVMAKSENKQFQSEMDLQHCYTIDIDWNIFPPKLEKVKMQNKFKLLSMELLYPITSSCIKYFSTFMSTAVSSVLNNNFLFQKDSSNVFSPPV